MTGERLDGCLEFHERVSDCVDDLNELLPGLSLRYDMPVVIGAMAEHVGLAIWALRHEKLCDMRHASLAVQHLEWLAFPPQVEQPSSSPPENSTPSG
jgi:hypothetical protein